MARNIILKELGLEERYVAGADDQTGLGSITRFRAADPPQAVAVARAGGPAGRRGPGYPREKGMGAPQELGRSCRLHVRKSRKGYRVTNPRPAAWHWAAAGETKPAECSRGTAKRRKRRAVGRAAGRAAGGRSALIVPRKNNCRYTHPLDSEGHKRAVSSWGLLGLLGLDKWLVPIDDATRSPFAPYGLSGIMLVPPSCSSPSSASTRFPHTPKRRVIRVATCPSAFWFR